jgi:hypothetical protein
MIKKYNLSAGKLADKAGVEYRTFTFWLNGHYDTGNEDNSIDEKIIARICEMLGIEIKITYKVHPMLEDFIKDTLWTAWEHKRYKKRKNHNLNLIVESLFIFQLVSLEKR